MVDSIGHEALALLTPEKIWDYGPIFSSMRLRGVGACSVFYCFYGRNAWHSTWTSKYSNDCMHVDFSSAASFAERERKQGSVFYIEKRPALKLKAGDFIFLITQINEPNPLRQYSATAIRESPDEDVKQGYRRNNYLTFGASLSGVLSSFNHDSRFWATGQPPSNSVIVLFHKGEDHFTPLGQSKLEVWKSSSVGKQYYLNWEHVESRVQKLAVIKLVDDANFEGT